MANRYVNTHKNLTRNEVDYTVNIIDDLGSPIGNFSIFGVDGVKIYIEGPTRDLLPGVYTTTATINFAVSDAQQELLISDLRSLNRGRFAMEVLKDGNQIFVGRFGQHNISIQNAPQPYSVTIQAECGLGTLKNFKYRPTATTFYTGQKTFLEHIQNCFDKLDIQEHYTGDFIDFTVNWFHADMPDVTTNPLEYARVDSKAFRKDSDALNCFEVLQRICTTWGARMYYANGLFHMEQMSERDDANFQRWVYDDTFTETASSGTDSVEITVDNGGSASLASGTGPLTGGSFGVLDNLKAVDVTLEIQNGNLAEGLEWDYQDDSVQDLGVIRIDSDDAAIEVKGVWEQQTISALSTLLFIPHRFIWTVDIQLTNQSTGVVWQLSREMDLPSLYDATSADGTFFNPTYEDLQFFLLSQPKDEIEQAGFIMSASFAGATANESQIINWYQNNQESPQWSLTEPLAGIGSEGDSFSVSMRVRLDAVVGQNLQDISADLDYEFRWWFRNASFRVTTSEGGQSSQTVKIHYIAENDIEAERTLEITTNIADLPNKDNGIQVYDGTDWNYSDKDWAVGALTGGSAIALLLAQDQLKLRREAKETYQGSFITHEAQQDARITYRSKQWLPIRTTIATGTDLIQGYFVEIAVDDISGTTDTEVDVIQQDPNELPVPTPYSPPDPPLVQTPIDPPGLITDEPIDTVSAYTTVDVQNNSNITLSAGSWIQVLNQSTGQTELVQLTADLGASDTSISISSNTFSVEFPTGSPIAIAQVEVFDWIEEVLTADGVNNYVTVTGPLSDPAAFTSDRVYFRDVLVFRGGGVNACVFNTTPTASYEHGIDKANERVTFPTNWVLNPGEVVVVRYKIPRS